MTTGAKGVKYLLAACAAWPLPAMAQGEAAPAGMGGDEIIVTARRQAETLLDVPVAVTALSQNDISRYASSDLTRVGQIAPQVEIYTGGEGSGGAFSIRGINTNTDDPGFEQSVGIVLDGAPISRGYILALGLYDIKQVEILKGPQALFFGKNSPAGVINVTTAGPGDHLAGYVKGGYEFRAKERYIEGAIGGPLSDTLGIRIAARASDMDGWVKNHARPLVDPSSPVTVGPGNEVILPGASDRDTPATRNLGIRGTLVWSPNADVTSTLKLQYGDLKSNVAANFERVCAKGQEHPFNIATGQFDTQSDCKLNRRRAVSDIPALYNRGTPDGWDSGKPFNRVKTFLGTWANSISFGSLNLDLTTAYYSIKRVGRDNDSGTIFSEFSGGTNEDTKNFSQEVRLASDFEGPLNFTIGGFYEHNKRSQYGQLRLFAVPPDPRNGSYQTSEKQAFTKGETFSLFGQARFNLTPDLELAGGVRWTKEKKRARQANTFVNCYYTAVCGAGDAFLGEGDFLLTSFSDDNFSPEATLTWKIDNTQTLYAAFKTGYKSGALSNPIILTPQPAGLTRDQYEDSFATKPEKARGGEIGYKANLFNGRLRAEIVAYYYKFADLQLSSFNSETVSYSLLNAASAKQKGIEAQFNFKATDGLQLRLAAGYNSLKFGKFDSAPCYAFETEAQGCVGGVQDFSGRQLYRAPKFSSTMGASYDFDINADMRLGLDLDAKYSSSYYAQENFNPSSHQKSFWLLNAGVKVYSSDDRWELAFIGRNLTNENYLTYVADAPAGGPGEIVAASVRGRELAAQFTFKFGQ